MNATPDLNFFLCSDVAHCNFPGFLHSQSGSVSNFRTIRQLVVAAEWHKVMTESVTVCSLTMTRASYSQSCLLPLLPHLHNSSSQLQQSREVGGESALSCPKAGMVFSKAISPF